jgi:hypothetical protein
MVPEIRGAPRPAGCRSWLSGNVPSVESSHEERVARNEELFQEVNRQIEKLEEKLGHRKTFAILCECSKKHCLDTLEVEPEVYQRVRSNPLLFFLVPGHEDPEVERVVERAPQFLVVEKTGQAADAVRERNR